MFLGTLFSNYQSNSNESSSHYQPTSCPHITMTNHNDDRFFFGFLPVWAIALFAVAVLFLGLFLAGIICYLAGCRRPASSTMVNNENVIPMVEQPLIKKIPEKSTHVFNDDQF